ncbi:uncharacterized protein LOC122242976 [Penaeus japonicus]|uniref:uncharacterized protein LOC122242976 n=1 Tax=Penaeus japonicus TaxID=27405 RepID=UPI001C7152D2|nr:uncharacterized protein LOC122242976 [Penaeus japonicus]
MPRLKTMRVFVILSMALNIYLFCLEDIDGEGIKLRYRHALEQKTNIGLSPYVLLSGLEWDDERQAYTNSLTMTPEEIIKDMEKKSRNLPIAFVERKRNKIMQMTQNCARFPSVYDIQYNNMYWQQLITSKGALYLYGAYYDNRALEPNRPVVRILTIMDITKGLPETTCQFWFDEMETPVFSDASYSYVWGREWNFGNVHGLYPYLITCNVPKSHRHLIPQAVSLVERACDFASNSLRVIYNLPEDNKQEDFVVCVKGFDFYFEDFTERIIEWLELLSLMGAHKVFYYSLSMNAKMEKMMRYYEDKGLLEVIPTTLPGSQPNIPGIFLKYVIMKDRFQHEVIQFNDCYYRNMYRYKYTVNLDTDELIVPRFATTWHDLMQTLRKKSAKDNLNYSSYCARHTFYMDHMLPAQEWLKGIPSHMHILQHVLRSANYSRINQSIKCFHDTTCLKHLHNHFPFLALADKFPLTYYIPTGDAQLQHYRQTCQGFVPNCYETFKRFTVYDPTVWKYKEELIKAVNQTFFDLGYQ